jgi:hypothetical protein
MGGWTRESVRQVVNYLSLDHLFVKEVTVPLLVEVVVLADYCNIDSLKSICEQQLAQLVTRDNACLLLQKAVELSLQSLQQVCLSALVFQASSLDSLTSLTTDPTIKREMSRAWNALSFTKLQHQLGSACQSKAGEPTASTDK